MVTTSPWKNCCEGGKEVVDAVHDDTVVTDASVELQEHLSNPDTWISDTLVIYM